MAASSALSALKLALGGVTTKVLLFLSQAAVRLTKAVVMVSKLVLLIVSKLVLLLTSNRGDGVVG